MDQNRILSPPSLSSDFAGKDGAEIDKSETKRLQSLDEELEELKEPNFAWTRSGIGNVVL